MTESHQRKPFFSGSISLGNVITVVTGVVAVTVFVMRLEGTNATAAIDRAAIRTEINSVERGYQREVNRLEQLSNQRFSDVERRLGENTELLREILRRLDDRP
ncbi:MAG: hypothetical protein AB8B85_05455 [Paracoccaceae bacterium]